jgi:medium-chain acyl-[acyl-carrier-protein] hydrolase
VNAIKASWLICLRHQPDARLRLFCFPYAGGAAVAYRGWPEGLPASIEVWAIQPPGRGARLKETCYLRINPLIQDLFTAIVPFLDVPFAFFGHSLGALVAFELTRILRRESSLLPARLFVSGCAAPQLLDHELAVSKLPDDEFLERLRILDGTPPQVLENKELLQVFLPTIRADYSVYESYAYAEENDLDTEISIYGGMQDKDVSLEQLEGWRSHTTAPAQLKMFPGGHFFVQTSQALLLRSVAQDLI